MYYPGDEFEKTTEDLLHDLTDIDIPTIDNDSVQDLLISWKLHKKVVYFLICGVSSHVTNIFFDFLFQGPKENLKVFYTEFYKKCL